MVKIEYGGLQRVAPPVHPASEVLYFSPSLCLGPSFGCFSLFVSSFCGAGSKAPLGILTLAYDARLNEAAAFPGLSVFEGEEVSTKPEGRLGVRVGRTTVLLAGSSGATLHGIDSGAHVDLTAGTVPFSSPENGIVEIHAEEAFLRPEENQLTQAEVTIVAPGVLQIRARRGDLAFRYREEFQVLPEGATYRVYLDSPGEPKALRFRAGKHPADRGRFRISWWEPRVRG